jgi:hypothetical protein
VLWACAEPGSAAIAATVRRIDAEIFHRIIPRPPVNRD